MFTYAVPESLREIVQPGTRVLVPFRNKSLVGVIVELDRDTRPPARKSAKSRKCSIIAPALTPKLIELGHWIAGYYLAPVGEVFRAMLPPVTEVRSQREIALTEAGRDAVASLSGGELSHGLARSEVEFLAKLAEKESRWRSRRLAKVPDWTRRRNDCGAKGLIEIRETDAGPQAEDAASHRLESEAAKPRSTPRRSTKKRREYERSLEERGPLPLPQLLKLASVSRAVIERMLRDGLLESWEERIDPAEDPFDVGYESPAHELNAEQESAFGAIRARFELGRIWRAAAARRHRQREDRSVYARGAGNAGARQDRDRAGAGNRADAVGRPAMPRVVWRAIRRRRGAALGAERRGARARMVARAQRRSARRRRARARRFLRRSKISG